MAWGRGQDGKPKFELFALIQCWSSLCYGGITFWARSRHLLAADLSTLWWNLWTMSYKGFVRYQYIAYTWKNIITFHWQITKVVGFVSLFVFWSVPYNWQIWLLCVFFLSFILFIFFTGRSLYGYNRMQVREWWLSPGYYAYHSSRTS